MSEQATVVAEYRNAGRRFGATWAIRDLSLKLYSGRIHAFVGENGAGKSTCLGLLAGRHKPSEGEVVVLGTDVAKLSPRELLQQGISSVHQELTIFPFLTVAQNTALGREPSNRIGWLSRSALRKNFRERAAAYGASYDPDQRAGELSIAARQTLELIRNTDDSTVILLLDEPTATLPPKDREQLFTLVRERRDAGVAVVFVSHNLNEVLELADDVSVFCDGRHVATKPAAQWTESSLIEAMIGKRAGEPAVRSPLPKDAPVTMSVRGLSSGTKLHDISLDLRRGEVVGVAGLAGSGRSTLLRTLGGDLRAQGGGEITIRGRTGRIPRSSVEALRRGIMFIPEDRRRDGLFIGHPAWQNVAIGDLTRGSRFGLVNRRRLRAGAAEATRHTAFADNRLQSPVEDLSGGNQQKLLMARPLYLKLPVLLADEPTRGVDIGARADIWNALREQAANGLSILVVSSEIEELLLACDRVLVLSKGAIADEIIPDRAAVNVKSVLHRAFAIDENALYTETPQDDSGVTPIAKADA